MSQNNLLCSFSLFVKSRLGLSTVTTLFSVIVPLSLGVLRILAPLVLCHLVGMVLATVLVGCPACLRNVHHVGGSDISTKS